jgi:hypothetical protein
MEKNQNKKPEQKTTKEMSSDVEKVKGQHQAPPPKGPGEKQSTDNQLSREDEEAEKGHS